jgi:hypothetical protein
VTGENTENPELTEAVAAADVAPGADTASDTASDTAAEAPAPRRRLRPRRVGVVAAVAALLLVTVAGAGYTAYAVHGADRSPGAPSWSLPKSEKDKEKAAGTKATGLRAMLLPYGEDRYGRGPDIAEYGYETELSGAQTADLRKKSIRDLPRSERRMLEREIDKKPVKGMAMRSYLSTAHAADSTAYAHDAFAVEIVLAQMADPRTVRSMAATERQIFDQVGIFRKGPKIEGHKDAACFRPPAGSRKGLDGMVCFGYVGDVYVTATATAGAPLDTKGVAAMVRAQLDRIKDPGKAV